MNKTLKPSSKSSKETKLKVSFKGKRELKVVRDFKKACKELDKSRKWKRDAEKEEANPCEMLPE
jgi:endo-beta-N-acetylglucosaminidase D